MERADNTYVQLCGGFVVELHGRRVEQRFPSRQGRVLFAYLVLQRPPAVGRHELIDAAWRPREQLFLLPPDVREWLPENHLAWFVIDAVGVMDLAPSFTGPTGSMVTVARTMTRR